MGKRKRPKFIRVSQNPPKRREPETEKEIRGRIAELEYTRIKLPKYPNSRIILRWESLTNEIKRLYKKLEAKKKNE